ncbi:MAG: hydroxymethylglutaryl-CoA lyase, partial [Oscillibacter sp.]
MTENKTVQIVEIGPRDGFQNVKEFIPTEYKLHVIDGLAAAGMKKIQCTSFVSPTAIPQMRDAGEVAMRAMERHPEVAFFALVPNYRGAQAAAQAGLREITPVISLSESHNQSNVRRTHEESLAEIARIRQDFPDL